MTGMNLHMYMSQPGTVVYMPPEAFATPPRYTNKLDCFSFGVLALQIITRNIPSPTDKCETGWGRTLSEIERRMKDITLIESSNHLQPIVLVCLQESDTERPSADKLCVELALLKRKTTSVAPMKSVAGQGLAAGVTRQVMSRALPFGSTVAAAGYRF